MYSRTISRSKIVLNPLHPDRAFIPKLRYATHGDFPHGGVKALHQALVSRGHDVTRTPTDWMPIEASDEVQLLRATAQGRCIFTFNIRDFLALAERYLQHTGIILAAQSSWTLSNLIAVLDRVLSETQADE